LIAEISDIIIIKNQCFHVLIAESHSSNDNTIRRRRRNKNPTHSSEYLII
jgi:uncharacterized protein (UPF0303 family)